MTANNLFTIWRFVDGKPGHEKQSQALVNGLKEQMQGLDIQVLDYQVSQSLFHYFWRWLTQRVIGPSNSEQPQLIIGAGHKTHGPMLLSKCQNAVKAVVILSPSLPSFLFDMIIAPEHDYYNKRRPDNLLTVPFALVDTLDSHPSPNQGLILLGGESKWFSWNSMKVAEQIKSIIELSPPDISWSISNSRRSPEEVFEQIQQACGASCTISLLEYTELADTWLPQQLSTAGRIWVSADSASMISEALATNAQVGIIALPSKVKKNKLQCAIDTLISRKQVLSTQSLPFAITAERTKPNDVISKLIKHLELIT